MASRCGGRASCPCARRPAEATISLVIGNIAVVALFAKLFSDVFRDQRSAKIEDRAKASEEQLATMGKQVKANAEDVKEIKERQDRIEHLLHAALEKNAGESWSYEKARKCLDD